TWSAVGNGVEFADANLAHSAITANASGTYALVWSVENGTCIDRDTLSFSAFDPVIAEAGADAEICGYTIALNAQGTGNWSSTADAVIADLNDPHSSVTVQAQGTYSFQWNVANGPCTASDEVAITFYTPISSSAGPDRSMCATSTIMEAVGVGTWNSPTGGVIIADPTDPHTTVSALSPGTYFLSWTLVNGVCVGTDEVALTFHPTVVADAGADQEVCGFDAQLTAQGNGAWSLSTGIAANDANMAEATVHADHEGTYTLTWTATNGTCSSVDEVTLVFHAPVSVAAGADQQVCGLIATLAGSGTGTWIAPAGVLVSQSNDPNAQASTEAAGTYALIRSAVNGTCTASDTVSITFIAAPDAAFQYDANVFCSAGLDAVPTAVNASGSYSATPAGLVIDGTTGTIDVSASTLGSYTITYALNGSCPTSTSTTITLSSTADASWNAPGPLCANSGATDLSTFLTTGLPGGSWSGAGVTGSSFDPQGLEGAVTITYTAGTGACAASQPQTIVVDPMPEANAGSDQALCTLEATLAATLVTGSGTWS
ncbi:MAG TPA: hypothetical protein VHL57_07380, partial [Flavobacteriales bacterium]|nr:hypothetical protein [Flavobacteriales bacterium]